MVRDTYTTTMLEGKYHRRVATIAQADGIVNTLQHMDTLQRATHALWDNTVWLERQSAKPTAKNLENTPQLKKIPV